MYSDSPLCVALFTAACPSRRYDKTVHFWLCESRSHRSPAHSLTKRSFETHETERALKRSLAGSLPLLTMPDCMVMPPSSHGHAALAGGWHGGESNERTRYAAWIHNAVLPRQRCPFQNRRTRRRQQRRTSATACHGGYNRHRTLSGAATSDSSGLIADVIYLNSFQIAAANVNVL